MAGVLVPLVLIPRYTTYTGANGTSFTTVGMDVSDFEKAILSFWRSAGVNLASVTIAFEESTDQSNWTGCGGGPFADPGATTETQFQPTLTKRWFRINVTLNSAANCAVTCWCVGFLQQRES
jgi:hypothetical protein